MVKVKLFFSLNRRLESHLHLDEVKGGDIDFNVGISCQTDGPLSRHRICAH